MARQIPLTHLGADHTDGVVKLCDSEPRFEIFRLRIDNTLGHLQRLLVTLESGRSLARKEKDLALVAVPAGQQIAIEVLSRISRQESLAGCNRRIQKLDVSIPAPQAKFLHSGVRVVNLQRCDRIDVVGLRLNERLRYRSSGFEIGKGLRAFSPSIEHEAAPFEELRKQPGESGTF